MASERATNLAEAIRYDISSRGEFDRGAVAAIIDAELAEVRAALKGTSDALDSVYKYGTTPAVMDEVIGAGCAAATTRAALEVRP